mgnify:CR=1 FL=1
MFVLFAAIMFAYGGFLYLTNEAIGKQAQAKEKPILGLYRTTEGKRLSAMMSGNSYLQIREYTTLQDNDAILSDYFKK